MKRSRALYAQVHACVECPLGLARNNAVPASVGKGYSPGGIAVIGESPGYAENKSGKPFTAGKGRPTAGTVLNQVLGAANMKREDLMLSYLVRCKPVTRLQDAPEALPNCDQWTVAELEHYDPGLVILVGGTAMQTVFGQTEMISRKRGQARRTGDKHPWGGRLFMPTYHPNAALHNEGLFDTIVGDFAAAYDLWVQTVAF
jgi:DNA polymerase